MVKLALKRGEVDEYSIEKLVKFKRKYPELTFTNYLILSNYGISDTQIIGIYGVGRNSFYFFKSNHKKVLKEVRNWA